MKLRVILNRNPYVIGTLVVAIAASALWVSYRRSYGYHTGPADKYFTTDDGQTYFEGGMFDFPPFMKDGKEAVRAYLFECDGKIFVGYLERFNKQSRPAMDDLIVANREKRPPKNLGAIVAAARDGTEIKRPGDKEWISGSPGPKANEIKLIKCKDETNAIPKNY